MSGFSQISIRDAALSPTGRALSKRGIVGSRENGGSRIRIWDTLDPGHFGPRHFGPIFKTFRTRAETSTRVPEVRVG